uniref:Uncharacterized protein n=1 Tax=Glossina austeni TaxID=7395 RepID=A0A1A9V7R1_GLOAU
MSLHISIDFVVRSLLNDLQRHNKSMPTSIIREIWEKYTYTLEHHRNILMELLICCLRDKNKITLQLNLPNHPEVLIFNCLSEIFESAQKSVLRSLLELSCYRSSQTTFYKFYGLWLMALYGLVLEARLVRALSMQRLEDSLEDVDALVGYAIILLDFFSNSNLASVFSGYKEQMQKKILDIRIYYAD